MKFSLIKRATAKILLITVFFACMTSFAVFASSELNVEQLADDSIVISGNSGASLKRNTATLYIENGNSKLVYADDKLTQTNGDFDFVWMPEEADDYTISVRVGKVLYSKTIWYSSVTEYNRLMALMSTGSSNDIQSVLSSESSLKTLGIATDILGTQSPEEISGALYCIREYKNAGENVFDYIDEAKTVAEFVATPNAQTLKSFIDTVKALGMEISQYEFFKKITNAEILGYATDEFAKKLYDNFGKADAFFTENMVISAVYKCELWTELDDYLSKLGYEKYNNSPYKDAAAQAVAGVLYESKALLEAALSTAIDNAQNANKRPNPPSYGGGGGGGGSSSGGGSKVGASINTVAGAVSPDVKGEEPESKEKLVFNDVPESHWVFEAVNYLRWKGIVVGDDYNSFYPDAEITRAQMCAMLTRAYDISAGECTFADVASDAWYYAPIAAAYSAGLVEGDGENFRPNDKITRQDMAVLVYRFAKNSNKEFTTSQLQFADEQEISDYAKEAVSAMTASGIINGMDNNRFAPAQTAARAQAAKLIYEAIR